MGLRCMPAAVALAASALAAPTTFLDQDALLGNMQAPSWYKDNIPFLDVPDATIQEIYYFRWQAYKGHIYNTGPEYGYLATEFLIPPNYGAPFGGVVAAAGHHINEGKWIHNPMYVDQIIDYWLSGPGQIAKPMTDNVNMYTSDWAHEYSFWAASAVWNHYTVTGDKAFVTGQLVNLVRQWHGWDNQFNATWGLYWQAPVWDASELTASSYASGEDPYHGGLGYRPTINSYQYGDAVAIANIAELAGDANTASDFRKRASDLKTNMKKNLWSSNQDFYMHRFLHGTQALFDTREYMGFIPWMFNMPDLEDTIAFDQLMDHDGFGATFGPSTCERRSSWYMHDALLGCCRWDGPSWPFATAQVLTAVENVLNNYDEQSHITSSDYVQLLQGYAATHYQDGHPAIYQAHHPDENNWIYRNGDQGDTDYNHSTFVDNVISGLIGLRAQGDDTLVVNPLAPSDWSHFALENVAYHGHSITILWDADGTRYNQGKGLMVFVDGKLAKSSSSLGKMTVDVAGTTAPFLDDLVNIASNPLNFQTGTSASASYSWVSDNPGHINDGTILRTDVPNSRWTSYRTPNESDWVMLDMHRRQYFSRVHLYFYADSDGVPLPSSYKLQYCSQKSDTSPGCKPDDCRWREIPDQMLHQPVANSPNDPHLITFPGVQTSQVRVIAPNPGNGRGWGLSEFEVWADPVFVIQNQNSGHVLGTGSGSNVIQDDDNYSAAHQWLLVKNGDGWYKIKNIDSGLLLAVEQASTAVGAQLKQSTDNGSPDQLWRVNAQESGYYYITNKNSGLVAGVQGMSKDSAALVRQAKAASTPDQLWAFLASVPGS